jgi:hypothetical protein
VAIWFAGQSASTAGELLASDTSMGYREAMILGAFTGRLPAAVTEAAKAVLDGREDDEISDYYDDDYYNDTEDNDFDY